MKTQLGHAWHSFFEQAFCDTYTFQHTTFHRPNHSILYLLLDSAYHDSHLT
jgi:hypothetical protein